MASWMIYAVGFAIKSTAILAAAWLVTRAMAKRSAAARHMVWTAAFGAVLLLPALTAALPALRAPGLGRVLPSASDPVFRTTVTSGEAGAAVLGPAAAPGRPVGRTSTNIALPDWRIGVLLVWAMGALLLPLRTAIACIRMMRARRAASEFGAACDGVDVPAGVRVLKSASGSMPLAFGIVRPVVFLPADALLWEGERRRMVLAHEFAHIERGDLATHFLANAGVSLLWWNPMAWKAWGEFLKERERAADDLVLRAGGRASAYASHLLEIARSARQGWMGELAAVAMARPAQLEGRLMAILDGTGNHGAPRKMALAAAAVAALTLTLPLAALQSQDQAQVLPGDADATLRTAVAEKNYAALDQAAEALMKNKDFDRARRLYDSALQIRGAVSGMKSASYAQGLILIGHLEMARNQTAAGTDVYERAVAVGSNRETFDALMAMGLDAYKNREASAAVGYFERANIAASTPDWQARALILLAQADQLDPNRIWQAQSHYLAAMNAVPADSGQRFAAQTLYARYLEGQGRADEAKTMLDQAEESRKALSGRARSSQAGGSASPVHKVGNGVSQPVPIFHPQPDYTEEARVVKYQGSVLLYIEVAPDGSAQNVTVIRPLGMGLDEKAIAIVSQWKFRPAMLNGQPVAVQANVEVNFKLL